MDFRNNSKPGQYKASTRMIRSILKVETSAKAMPWPNLPEPEPPMITLNKKPIVPDIPPDSPAGYQAVILDNLSLKVLFNKYFTVPSHEWSWYNTYQEMYKNMYSGLLNSGGVKQENLLIVASFGLGNNLPPTPQFLKFLIYNGADGQLEYWYTHCDPGSQMANSNWWMVIPTTYILVGVIESDIGLENYQIGEWNGQVKGSLSTLV